MPWIPPEFPPPRGRRGGEQPIQQRIRCDQCSLETKNAYWGQKDSRQEAGVWWPKTGQNQGESEYAAWCPRCASAACEAARQSYEGTHLDVESVMSASWKEPIGRAVVPANTAVATAHRDQGPPMAPLPGASSQAHPGRVPPKAPPPGI